MKKNSSNGLRCGSLCARVFAYKKFWRLQRFDNAYWLNTESFKHYYEFIQFHRFVLICLICRRREWCEKRFNIWHKYMRFYCLHFEQKVYFYPFKYAAEIEWICRFFSRCFFLILSHLSLISNLYLSSFLCSLVMAARLLFK